MDNYNAARFYMDVFHATMRDIGFFFRGRGLGLAVAGLGRRRRHPYFNRRIVALCREDIVRDGNTTTRERRTLVVLMI